MNTQQCIMFQTEALECLLMRFLQKVLQLTPHPSSIWLMSQTSFEDNVVTIK